jgi:hypothetical protein
MGPFFRKNCLQGLRSFHVIRVKVGRSFELEKQKWKTLTIKIRILDIIVLWSRRVTQVYHLKTLSKRSYVKDLKQFISGLTFARGSNQPFISNAIVFLSSSRADNYILWLTILPYTNTFWWTVSGVACTRSYSVTWCIK